MAGYGNNNYGNGGQQQPRTSKPGSGSVFLNDRKEKDTHPDLSGSINLSHNEGPDTNWFSAWLRCPKGNEQAIVDIVNIMKAANVRISVAIGKEKQPKGQGQGGGYGGQGGQQGGGGYGNGAQGGQGGGYGGQGGGQQYHGSATPQGGGYGAPQGQQQPPPQQGYGQQAPQGGYGGGGQQNGNPFRG